MDRNLHRRWIPECPSYVPPVNQYMWKDRDDTILPCYNGISHPIYDYNGHISYTLPLDMYPQVDKIHPQVVASRVRPNLPYRVPIPPHKNIRSLTKAALTGIMRDDDRLDGFYAW